MRAAATLCCVAVVAAALVLPVQAPDAAAGSSSLRAWRARRGLPSDGSSAAPDAAAHTTSQVSTRPARARSERRCGAPRTEARRARAGMRRHSSSARAPARRPSPAGCSPRGSRSGGVWRAQDPGRVFAGCCPEPGPGRWCCRDGARCCPPRALPRQEPAPPVAMPAGAMAQPDAERGRELAVLVEEAVSGLLGTCWPLRVAGRGSEGGGQAAGWEAVTVPAAANLREAAAHACRRPAPAATIPGNASQAHPEAQCIRLFAEAAVRQALLTRGDAGGATRRAVYLAVSPGAAVVCTPTVKGLRGEFGSAAAEDGTMCGAHFTPPLAFRWLKSAEAAGPHLLIPRHPRGQVLVSDEYRFIFVHVPKAGSTTVRALLWERGGIDNQILSRLDLHRRSTYLTFAFVRDPLRRFVSAYDEICLKLGPTCAFYDDTSPQGLRDFLAYTREHPCWDEHVCTQMSFLVGEDGQMIRLDVLAATEHLVPAMTHISTVLEFDPPLSPESLAPRNQGSRSAALNELSSAPDIVRGICELYAVDYSCLGFSVPAVCRNQSLRSLDQAPGVGKVVDGAAGWAPWLADRGAGTGRWAQNAVYPGEWHDTDVGLPSLVRDLQVPTVELYSALERHPCERPACSTLPSLLLSPRWFHENSTVRDASVRAASEHGGDEAVDRPPIEGDALSTATSETCSDADRQGEGLGELDTKAGLLRGLIASTLIRLNLGKPLLLPCCSAETSTSEESPSSLPHPDPHCDSTSRALCSVAGSSCKRVRTDESRARTRPSPSPVHRNPGPMRPHGVHRAQVRELVKEANSLPLGRKYGALWARASTMQWLWRPHAALLSAVSVRIEALPHSSRLLKGEHVAVVVPTCPPNPVGDGYPHVTDDPCSMEQGWRDGRLDSAPENACYPTVHAAKCESLLSPLHSATPPLPRTPLSLCARVCTCEHAETRANVE